jgi:hypothetical protein
LRLLPSPELLVSPSSHWKQCRKNRAAFPLGAAINEAARSRLQFPIFFKKKGRAPPKCEYDTWDLIYQKRAFARFLITGRLFFWFFCGVKKANAEKSPSFCMTSFCMTSHPFRQID